MMDIQTRESLVASRALQLLGDIAREMQEKHLHGLRRRPRFTFRAKFYPELGRYDEQAVTNYRGVFQLEGRGRGLAAYYQWGSHDRTLARKGWAPVVTLRLLPQLVEKDDDPRLAHACTECSDLDKALMRTASCLFVAPRLVPAMLREEVRRFMRDYFGNDDIRFFDEPLRKGMLISPWLPRDR
ncbi:MAG: hypothetical protein AAB737_01015 [Patescibacteria group bacterium]